jgi:hypothetical protein
LVVARQLVEERRLARVRVAHQGNRRLHLEKSSLC